MSNYYKDESRNHFRFENQIKKGFYPTDIEIVELEMNMIDFSDLADRNISINICDLTGGTGEQLNHMNTYLTDRNIKTNCYYNDYSQERFNIAAERYPYFNSLNTNVNTLKLGINRYKQIDKKCFALIRNNPPYGFDDVSGVKIRLEKKITEVNYDYSMQNSIQIFELPIGQLDIEMLNFLTARYKVKLFKFPKGQFEKHKQVVFFMKRKQSYKKDNISAKELLSLVEEEIKEPGKMPVLGEVTEKVFSMKYSDFKNSKPLSVFRDSHVNANSLASGSEYVIKNICDFRGKVERLSTIPPRRVSIIEPLAGHLAQNLIAGANNGIVGDLLVHGSCTKRVDIVKEDDDNGNQKEIEIEKIIPCLECTNRNGDYVVKDMDNK